MSHPSDLEGNIHIGGQGIQYPPLNQPHQDQGAALYSGTQAAPLNTLDEPVIETIKRDLRMISYKLKYVMNPKAREEGVKELRNWDLWGPLLLCLALAFVLSFKASDSANTIFGTIFVIIWGGASILTLNAKFLGGKISFFQSVCVLGYCVFPILLAAALIIIIEFLFTNFLLNLLICGGALFWAVTSSTGFMQALVSEEKKLLAVYPVLLFYMSLSWFVLIAG